MLKCYKFDKTVDHTRLKCYRLVRILNLITLYDSEIFRSKLWRNTRGSWFWPSRNSHFWKRKTRVLTLLVQGEGGGSGKGKGVPRIRNRIISINTVEKNKFVFKIWARNFNSACIFIPNSWFRRPAIEKTGMSKRKYLPEDTGLLEELGRLVGDVGRFHSLGSAWNIVEIVEIGVLIISLTIEDTGRDVNIN